MAPAVRHALAMHGSPALPPGFRQFPYVNPEAPKGGTLRLGASGTFDSLNPFIFRGLSAPGLREYVYESLLERSADEPFTLYAHVAAGVEVAPDQTSVTFHLNPAARFSDGHPLTAEDVAFTQRLLRDKGVPYMRSHYRKVAATDVLGPRSIRFTFVSGGDRELPLIMGLMPILPKHAIDEARFEETTLAAVVGSGPYVVARVDAGRSVTYRRNPQYWARELPVERGRHNFDEVQIEFFRDANTLFEAFKAGEVDARIETEPSRWAEAYDFPAASDGRVVKREVPIGLPAGMSALVFNTRRAPFDDARVRRALIELLDAEWINRSLYHGLYKRTASFFARSDLASTGRPADARERSLLAPFPGAVRPEILDGRWHPPAGTSSGTDRAALGAASRLLGEAGYAVKGGRMVHTATGKPLAFEFLAATKAQERLLLAFDQSLKRLGIGMRIRQVDSAQYSARAKSFDFDMLQWHWPASLSPGNEQLNRWSSKAADTEGSLNYAGVKSSAADAMIEALLAAEKHEDFVSAVRALDRVLLSGDYVIPLFYAPVQWLAYWRTLGRPEAATLAGTDFDTWWRASERP